MRCIGFTAVLSSAIALAAVTNTASTAFAIDILGNGGLEDSTGPAGWLLTQSITGEPGSPISAVEHVNFANQPEAASGELGIYIRPFGGNVGIYEGQNKAINVALT